jgi:UDP-N-acetylglucosamine diphosphorylase / glucose-1-phosphate thymidylyltransferase / UDP-N-acetylgalactosamine diphosphorylase / glucosamine-1-phosphate N-acetyltransferase / galactosamine-1-phosphate N-acetyltransferase
VNVSPSEYLDFGQTEHADLFGKQEPVWHALRSIGDYLRHHLRPGIFGETLGNCFIGPHVYIGKGTVVENGATIKGPAWIGRDCEIRSGCYIRENVIVGDGVVLGNSCEFKNSLVFNEAEVPHFNYVGDSILGYKAHLAAGVILSNTRLDHLPIQLHIDGETFETGLRKFGAIVGDQAEIGCNSVLNPGTLIGRRSLIYPLTHWGGVLPADSILKSRQQHLVVSRVGR